MPDDGDIGGCKTTIEYEPDRRLDDVEGHAMAIGAGRKIAVAAINVAERRRLQNEKARGPGEFRQAHAFRQAFFHGCATSIGDDADTASRPSKPREPEEICCKYALRMVSKRSIGSDRFNWLGLAIADDDVIKSARSTPSRIAVPFLSTAFSRTLLTFDLLCRFLWIGFNMGGPEPLALGWPYPYQYPYQSPDFRASTET